MPKPHALILVCNKHKLKLLLLTAAFLCIRIAQAQPSPQLLDSLQQQLRNSKDHRQQTDNFNAIAKAWRGFNKDSILYYARTAKLLAEQAGYMQGKAYAVQNIAVALRLGADYPASMEAGLEAARIFDSLHMPAAKADILLDLAQLHKDVSGSNNTEAYLDKAILYAREAYIINASLRDTTEMADALNMEGICQRDKGKQYNKRYYYDSAAACYSKAILLIENATKGKHMLGKLYNNMSQVYNEYRIDYNKALEYLFKSVEINKANNYLTGLSHNYGNISYAYTMLGKHQLSLQFAYKMLEACRSLHSANRMQNAYGQMYRAYKGAGRLDSALAYYILQDKLDDSLTNLSKTAEMLELQTRYETNKKEGEISQLKQQGEARSRNITLLLIGICVLAGVMIWLSLLYRNMRRQKEEISKQQKRLEVMMKELHHRVKNNLQIVSSLLSLQTNRLDDENAIAVLKESQQRVQAMSFIHQRLYKTDNITSVNMKEYLTDLAESLVASYGYHRDDFDLQLHVNVEYLDIDKALPAGLIINELVTNSLKYAYKGITRPMLSISLIHSNETDNLIVNIRDNGIGIDIEHWKKRSNSFGKQLVNALCKQLRATHSVEAENGTNFTITIPLKAA